MKLMMNLGSEKPFRWLHRSRALGMAIKPYLDAQVAVNMFFMQLFRVPPLYKSGVRYQNEPRGQGYEEFALIPVIMQRGWGDCDDLAPWRVAELRRLGEKAKIRIQWRRQGNGQKLFHIVVRRGDGSVEDPSRILGM